MYIKRTFTAGRTVEVHKSFYQNRQGVTRGTPEGTTPAPQANYNDKKAKRNCIRKMSANFGPDGVHAVFEHWNRPSPEVAAKLLSTALGKLQVLMKHPSRWKKRCRQLGIDYAPYEAKELKYMKATGIGSRGGIHQHVVLNTGNLAMLRAVWPYGSVRVEALDPSGNYAYLARYFCGQAKGEPGGEVIIHGNRWSGSRNLVDVQPEVEKIDAIRWREPPKPKKGYIIDVDSVDAGVNWYGIPYLYYRQVQVRPMRVPGKTPAELAAELQAQNRAHVREVWAEKFKDMALRVLAPPNKRKKKPPGKGAPP